MRDIINFLRRILVKVMFSVFLVLLMSINSFGQKAEINYPKIGDVIKDYTFTDVINFSKKTLKIRDFRGKWLVLDFWAQTCGSCIASFPKMNKLNHQFSDQAQLLMVGLYRNGKTDEGYSKEALIKNRYYVHQKLHNLDFPVAFDSLAADVYDIGGLPAIFVINPQGVIVAKTSSIDSVALAALIGGKNPVLDPCYSAHQEFTFVEYHKFRMPLLTTGQASNGGIADTSFIYRSLLTKYKPTMVPGHVHGWNSGDPYLGFAEAVGVDLPSLIRMAYTGMRDWNRHDSLYKIFSRRLILEVEDTVKFASGAKVKDNIYAYSLTVPLNLAHPEQLRKIMLKEIEQCFSFKSHVEKRKVPVLNLVVRDQKKVSQLRSKGGNKAFLTTDKPGFTIINWSFKSFFSDIGIQEGLDNLYNWHYEDVPPVLDKTGIDFNIDMVFDGDKIDWATTLKVLRRYGLDLVKGEAEMKCIVIRDADDTGTITQ